MIQLVGMDTAKPENEIEFRDRILYHRKHWKDRLKCKRQNSEGTQKKELALFKMELEERNKGRQKNKDWISYFWYFHKSGYSQV